MISVSSSYARPGAGGTSAASASQAAAVNTADKAAAGAAPPAAAGTTVSISSLGSQLAASAARLDEMQRSLPRAELATRAKSLLDQIQGDSYDANKAAHDAEVPPTDDPALLARAKQATAFVNSAARGSQAVANPFGGLSREQLDSIVYDDSGAFTVNERRAASYEVDRQEEAWREQVCREAMEEYNRTARMDHFFQSVLDHFKGLPAIEQAQYPKDYEIRLQSRIGPNADSSPLQAPGGSEEATSRIKSFLKSVAGNTDGISGS